MKQEITYEDYNKVEIKVGTVLKVSKNEKARRQNRCSKIFCSDYTLLQRTKFGWQTSNWSMQFSKKKYSRNSF